MMLVGFNLLLWTFHLTDDVLATCERLKAVGYDGIEVPVFEGTPKDYATMGRKLDEIGLRRTVVGIVQDAERNPMSRDPTRRQAGVDYLKWMIDCSEALGAEVIGGPFYQPLATFSGEGPTTKEMAALVESHAQMAAHAEAAGVNLAVEPLNRFECYALNTIAQATDLVAAVGSPNYGCLFDTFHAHIEEKDPCAAIAQAGSAITHVHVSENDRGVPGRGQVDFEATFRALKAIGYDGWLTVEAFGRALPEIAAATKVWRPLFDTEEDVYTEGYALIRDTWQAA